MFHYQEFDEANANNGKNHCSVCMRQAGQQLQVTVIATCRRYKI